MKIRDVEVEFDFLDADDMARFEENANKVKQESAKGKEENLSMSEAIKRECKIIDSFFDNVFGEGISEKIFKGKKNLGEHVKAFEDIVKEKIRKQQDLQQTFNRYKPNREERRSKYKKWKISY